MVFSSFTFLFTFLPAVLFLYYLTPRKGRNTVLLLMSLLFYAGGEMEYLWLLLTVVTANYGFARLLVRFRPRAKWILAIGVSANLLCLGYFKYLPLVGIFNVRLPLGISFFIFQALSYLVDVYRRDVPVQKNIGAFATYITLFPQLIAGPIVRYASFLPQLKRRREGAFVSGVQLFLTGLAKKLLLANPMGALARELLNQPGFLASWGMVAAFAFQIYYDFSGYSDMARGLGRMFGFSFDPNFDYPYTAVSVTDFWRRWHISLSAWFREYVYIPLGGNRCGKGRQCVNLLIVWGLTGLWHGASWNYLLWGLYYALILCIEKLFLLEKLNKMPLFLRRCYTFFFVLIGWAIFYFEDMDALFHFLPRLFWWEAGNKEAAALLQGSVFLLFGAILGAGPWLRRILVRNRSSIWVRWGMVAAGGVGFLLCLGALAGQGYNPFLYFRF